MTRGVSLRGAIRLMRRTLLEWALAVAALAVYGALASFADRARAIQALLVLLCAAVAGLVALARNGELQLALRCPRLDALGLRLDTRHAPWTTLLAADEALRALDEEAGGYRDFFPEARRDLVKAASRAVDAQRRLARAQRALRSAPDGAARRLLEAQEVRAARELRDLTGLLRELRSRFVAATAPRVAAEDPLPALRALEARSDALACAAESLEDPSAAAEASGDGDRDAGSLALRRAGGRRAEEEPGQRAALQQAAGSPAAGATLDRACPADGRGKRSGR